MRNRGFLIICLFFVFKANGQKTLTTDTFRVVKEYQPTLVGASKITFEPVIDDDLKIDLDLSYSFVNKQIPVSFNIDPIAPAKIKGEPLVKLYNGYARVGVGNALIPFGEVYYNNLRSKKYSAGAHLKYFRLKELNQIEGSEMSQGHFEVFGKRFWKQNTLDANISYDFHNLNYYGYYDLVKLATAPELPNSEIEQSYNRLSSNLNLKTTKRDSFNLRHEFSVDYGLVSNKSGNTEHNIKAKANFNQFRNSELYNLDVIADYNQYDFNTDNTILGVTPQISTIGKKFRINAGLGVYVNADTDAEFYFYPLAEIKYNVIEDVLIPYVGVKGSIQRNNYNSLSLVNPFIAENVALANSNERYNIYLGIRGALSSKLTFNTSAAISNVDNSFFFVQIPDSITTLSKEYFVTYDELDELQLKGELVYTFSEKVKFYATGQFFDFSTEVEQRAWHRPNLKISTSVQYNLKEKLLVNLDLIYWGEQYARGVVIPGPELQFAENKLDGIFDANLSFEYRYTKRLSAFAKFNNIGGINFERYQNYPTQGFNVWGGLTFGF